MFLARLRHLALFIWIVLKFGSAFDVEDEGLDLQINHRGRIIKPTLSNGEGLDDQGKVSAFRPPESNILYIIHVNAGEIPIFERVFCRLYHEDNFYILNMNGMAPESDHRLFNQTVSAWNLANVMVMSPPHPAAKYGFSFVEVFIRGLTLGLKYSASWTHAIPLGALEYPLLNAIDMRRVAGSMRTKNISIMDARPIAEELKSRLTMLCKDPAIHSNTGTMEALSTSIFGLDPTPPSDRLKCRRKAAYMLQPHYPFYRGIWGAVLHRTAAKYVVEAPDGLPLRFQTAFAATFLPEESYFQTTLCNSPATGGSIVSLRQRFSRWSGESFEPDYLQLDQVPVIAPLGFMFARRVVDDEVMTLIDREICGSAASKVPPLFRKDACALCWSRGEGATQAPRRNYEAVVRRILRAELTNLGSCNPNITDILITDRTEEELMQGADSAEAKLAAEEAAKSARAVAQAGGTTGAVSDRQEQDRDDDDDDKYEDASNTTKEGGTGGGGAGDGTAGGTNGTGESDSARDSLGDLKGG